MASLGLFIAPDPLSDHKNKNRFSLKWKSEKKGKQSHVLAFPVPLLCVNTERFMWQRERARERRERSFISKAALAVQS